VLPYTVNNKVKFFCDAEAEAAGREDETARRVRGSEGKTQARRDRPRHKPRDRGNAGEKTLRLRTLKD